MFPATTVLLVLATACAGSAREAPPSNQAAVLGTTGSIGGHRFTLVIESGTLVNRTPTMWTWKLGNAEVDVQDLGPVDASSHFLVKRSPRTIVRSEGLYTIVTEVVVIAGDRVFGCTHEERVPDPDAPSAKEVVDRGVAVCSSLRVEP